MATRRDELTRQAARLFAQKGYHGTSIGEIAEAMGVQKGSLYAHIESKEDLLYETMREGAAAFHAALDAVPDELPATEKIRLALRAHLRVVAEQLDVATVFVREWRYLEGARREQFVAERRRYEERFRALFREGRELGELRTDLDDATRTLMRAAYLRTVRTERPRHAIELARDAGDADAVLVFSGDGGFNEALNGLDRADVPIGFIPGGGTSVLPRALGLPRDPVEAAERLAAALEHDRTRRISVGRVNGRRFAFSSGIGIDAEAVRRVDERGRSEEGRRAGDVAFVAT